MKILHTIILTTFLLFMSACGGGSSSGSGDSQEVDPPSNASSHCQNPSTTTSPYLVTSYDSCDASDLDLTGLWVILSDYSTLSPEIERTKLQRATMVISEEENGTLHAFVCNMDSALRDYWFSPGDNELIIYDDEADADINFSIINNVFMEGAHVTNAETLVQRSSASALKIEDTTSIGSMDLVYNLDGFSFSDDDLDITCFSQSKGTTKLLLESIEFDGEATAAFVEVNNNGTVEELSLDVFLPRDPTRETAVNLNFAESGAEIEGENDGDGDATATYIENSSSTVRLDASVVDSHIPLNTAEFKLDVRL